MLDLDTIRAEFAAHLAANASQRWRLDASIAHVVELAYRHGLDENAARVADLESVIALQNALITKLTIKLAEGEVSAMRESRRANSATELPPPRGGRDRGGRCG